MFSSTFVKPRPCAPLAPHQGIDVAQRIAELGDAELLAAADAYFAGLTTQSVQLRKPFSDPAQASQLAHHLGWIMQAADLFRGARVLDFGCATGWLSIGMAQMGCDVIGVDIAPAALRLAERLKELRRMPGDGRVEFLGYDGKLLPLADGSVDRIVVFDAFHHVRDQAATLREFARVLRPGGRIAMMEPGPGHSKTADSQREMSLHAIIENDIEIEKIAEMCRAAGLRDPEMLLHLQSAIEMSLREFSRWQSEGISNKRAKEILGLVIAHMTESLCFYIRKGDDNRDSRRAEGLGGELRLLSSQPATCDGVSGVALRISAKNTGPGVWLTEADRPGQVKIGAQLLKPRGAVRDLDHMRLAIEGPPVAPGAEVEVTGFVALPEGDGLKLDLVAESVAWFGALGKNQPLVLNASELAQRVGD